MKFKGLFIILFKVFGFIFEGFIVLKMLGIIERVESFLRGVIDV